jgi:DNA-binding IclR family transcriptional regulator
LTQLREQTSETANLLARYGDEVVYLEQEESWHALRHAGWIGRRIPLAHSASGRALVSGQPEAITVSDQIEEGVTAVACAIHGVPGQSAALSVTGPSMRLRGRKLDNAKAAVVAASLDVASRLRALR